MSDFRRLLQTVTLILTLGSVSAHAVLAQENIVQAIDYGVVADDGKSDTAALQRAIDECVLQEGGVVRLPHGETLSGTIRLGTGVTLEVPAGSVLRASKDASEYKGGAWITAENAKKIGLRGKGRLAGNGGDYFQMDWARIAKWVRAGGPSGMVEHPIAVRQHPITYMIQFVSSEDVLIQDLQIDDSQHWTVHLLACDKVHVEKVEIRNSPYGPYTDGFDIDACRHVVIQDCEVTAGDDAFCVKNTNKRGLARSSYNIVVERCIARSPTNGFKIGTETHADISNVTFRHCRVEPVLTIVGPLSAINIATVDGGHVSDVTVEDIHIEQARSPVFIRRGNRSAAKNPKALPGVLKDIVIRNITVENCTAPCVFSGLDGHPIENVAISHLQIQNRTGAYAERSLDAIPEQPHAYPEATMFGSLPAWALFARHVRGLTLVDFTVGINGQPENRLLQRMNDVERTAGAVEPRSPSRR